MAWWTSTLARLKATLFGPGGVSPEAGHGVLQGILPWGQAPRRGTRELLDAYRRLPFLHSLLRRIAEDVASTQWKVLAPGPRAKERGWYRTLARAPAATQWDRAMQRQEVIRRALAEGALVEVEEHPLLSLVETMNPALGGFDSWFVTQLHLELIGQAPLVRDNNAAGLPVALWPVAPHWVLQTPSLGNPFYRVSWNAWYREIPEADLLWQRIPDPENPYARGTSFGVAVADELDVAELRARYAKNVFFNDATPSAMVVMENAPAEEVNRLRTDLENKHRGPGKNGLHYVTNRKLQYQQLQPPMKDLQYAEQMESGRDLLLEVLQIPRELIGLRDGTNRATISAARYLYSTGVLVPRIERRRSFLQPLLDEYTKDAEGQTRGGLILSYVSPVPEDAEGERDYMRAVPAVYTVNEHRAQGGKPPLEGKEGDELFTPPAASPLGFSADRGRDDPPWARTHWELHDTRAARKLPDFIPCAHPSTAEEPDGFDCTPPVTCCGCGGALGCHWEPQPILCRACRSSRKAMGVLRAFDNALEALRPEALADEVAPIEEEGFQKWAQNVLEQFGQNVSFDMRNPKVRRLLKEHAGERIEDITTTTREQLRQALADVAASGGGVREARQAVEAVFEAADKSRAETIARTELVGLSNAANVEAWRQSGVVDRKEWLAVRDGATREAHQELDGQKVSLDEPFKTPEGATAQHPGGFGIASLDCNCRCTGLPVVAEAERAVRRAVALTEEQKVAAWKAFDQRLSAWEKEMLLALRRGFEAQREAVLSGLQ